MNKYAVRWRGICNEYLEEFCKKHDLPYEPQMWVGDDPGTIIEISDMWVDMDNLRYDIDHDIPEPKFEEWYWKRMDLMEMGVEHWMTYEQYCRGEFDPWTPEKLEKLRTMKQHIDQLTKEFEDEIDGYLAGEK